MKSIDCKGLKVYNGNNIANDDEFLQVRESFNSGTNPFTRDSIIYFDEDGEDPTTTTQEMVFDDSASFTITRIDILQYADAGGVEEIGTVTCNKSSASNQTTFSWKFNSTSVKAYSVEIYCMFGASKYTITYSIADANWADKVVISPLSPIEVEKGNKATVQVTPKNGYYFSGTDTCNMFIEDRSEYVPFTLTSDGKMYLEMDESYSNLILRLEFTVTSGEQPVVSKRTNFYTVYAPTDENMKKINSTVFIDNNDVIGKFISYKKFWCNIPTDGLAKMKAGSYDFNFEAPVVHGNIIDVDCGSVNVDELYHSLLDYSPFSRLTIYLPFIGFVDLDVKLVMGKQVRVNYRVDVLSGRCLAEIYTMIDDVTESCIASYAGTIASDEPLSQGQVNYKGGYELMTSMQLGELIPFILVNTQVPLDSGSVNLDGLPVEEVKRVGDCTGYIKYSFINASGCSGTDAEKTEIENLLKSGINI